jgi:cysteine desulfurase / selenocysteine lyase
LLYVREGVPLEQCFVGWLSRFPSDGNYTGLQNYELPPANNCTRYELGTLPYHDFWAMHSSVSLLVQLGIHNIEKHCVGLATTFADELNARGYDVANYTEIMKSAIVSIKASDSDKIHAKLSANGILCSNREGMLRFSFHIYNTVDDLERVIGIITGFGER